MPKPDDILTVYTTDNANEAEVLRAALHGEGIKCEVGGESQAGLAGTIEIQLLVRGRSRPGPHLSGTAPSRLNRECYPRPEFHSLEG
jgi:hypothetical protein